jgi:hypothetical protein
MLEIVEENVFVKKVKFQCSGSGQKYLYIPVVFEENGLDIQVGDEIDLYMDKKNNIMFFCYGQNTDTKAGLATEPAASKVGGSLVESWMARKKKLTRKSAKK